MTDKCEPNHEVIHKLKQAMDGGFIHERLAEKLIVVAEKPYLYGYQYQELLGVSYFSSVVMQKSQKKLEQIGLKFESVMDKGRARYYIIQIEWTSPVTQLTLSW